MVRAPQAIRSEEAGAAKPAAAKTIALEDSLDENEAIEGVGSATMGNAIGAAPGVDAGAAQAPWALVRIGEHDNQAIKAIRAMAHTQRHDLCFVVLNAVAHELQDERLRSLEDQLQAQEGVIDDALLVEPRALVMGLGAAAHAEKTLAVDPKERLATIEFAHNLAHQAPQVYEAMSSSCLDEGRALYRKSAVTEADLGRIMDLVQEQLLSRHKARAQMEVTPSTQFQTNHNRRQ